MTGISIFTHAVKMVLNNLGPALRIGAIPLLVLAIAGWLLAPTPPAPGAMPDTGAVFPALLLTVISIVVSLWVAVAWHRYILLEEQPGAFLPQWNGAAIWAYFKTAFIVGLILVAAAIPLFLVGGLLFATSVGLDGRPGFMMALLFFVTVGLPMMWLGYRLGPSLVGSAVDDPRSLGEAWRATAPGAVDFVALAFVSVLALWLPSYIASELPRALSVPLGAVIQWAATMIGVGVITTIFGHYVQGRALNA